MKVLYTFKKPYRTVPELFLRKIACSKNSRWVSDDFACRLLILEVTRAGRGALIIVSAVFTVCCSQFLSDLVAETNQTAIDVLRHNAHWVELYLICGRIKVLSWGRAYLHCWAFFTSILSPTGSERLNPEGIFGWWWYWVWWGDLITTIISTFIQ